MRGKGREGSEAGRGGREEREEGRLFVKGKGRLQGLKEGEEERKNEKHGTGMGRREGRGGKTEVNGRRGREKTRKGRKEELGEGKIEAGNGTG